MRHLTLRAAMLLARNVDWWECPEGVAACDWSRLPDVQLRERRHLSVEQTETPSVPEPTCPQCRALFNVAREVLRAA